ncbi:hypothetical protein Bbelb_344220 [Branchiostoma belcheri]|nr:hypothetical protein Bbelb_344220 [Branchiostoma belcheri]
MAAAQLDSRVDSAIASVLQELDGITSLKPEQVDALKSFVCGRDVLALLPTGFGKSLIYQIAPLVLEKLGRTNPIVIVVSPLVALMEDQVREAAKLGVKAVQLGNDDEGVINGDYQLVYGGPERFVLQDKWREMLSSAVYSERLAGIVVDEVHVTYKWGNGSKGKPAFREAFSRLGELRSLVRQGVVDVTIVSKYQFFNESDDTWLYCYYTGSLINQYGYQFGVEVDTGSGTRFTPQISPGVVTGGKSVRILNSVADVWPVAFTVTASLGDPVTLQMVQKSNRTGPLEWRRDGVGGTVLTGQNSTNLTIASVRSSDEGIYECYYQGDTERKQGIMRLIVRDCAENKWSPPSCGADCPVCYNGGVCDDNTGECVCPPGFHGQNCESACMHDKIGTSCTRECDSGDCTGQLLCVMDPYGCSCAPGLMGIECNTECPDGMYGAGCTQTCHCADGPTACDKKTGACTGGCLDFWTGDACQIRTVAVSYEDLFSKEEGHFFFGSSSDHITAYSDIDSEECARRCLEGYDSYDGVNPKCLSFNHRPAGSPEGGSARCWLSSSDTDTAASPGPEWDSWPYRNYYQRKHILAPQDCTDILALGIRHVYTVGNPQPFQAYCDMDTDGGSWTVIQRRQDGSVQFNRTWTEYEQGFGNTRGEYWLGLKNIHSLTTQKQSELYVYLEDWETNSRFARYSTFSVGDASSKYTATIDGYSGTATDSLDPSTKDGRHSINNRPFSTTDQDNDGVSSTDCAGTYGQGGWWYTPSCGYALLNGQYLTGCSVPSASCSSANGIVWYTWLGYRYSLRKTVMMVRSTNVSASPFKNCQYGGTLTPGPEDSGLYICACAEGWHGVFCDQECSGTYGPDCGITCGHCYGNQTCDRFTGKCPTGEAFVCAAGYYGDKCDGDCPHGLYGGDCIQTCHCTNGSDCNKTTGVCNGDLEVLAMGTLSPPVFKDLPVLIISSSFQHGFEQLHGCQFSSFSGCRKVGYLTSSTQRDDP